MICRNYCVENTFQGNFILILTNSVLSLALLFNFNFSISKALIQSHFEVECDGVYC